MANETEIGSLAINLKIKLEALEKGLETAKKKLQEIEKSNEKIKQSNSGLEASYIAMSVTAVASLVKIKSAIDDGVAESDLNASIKNLLLYGYTAEQATDILKRLQDSAVGNRQECYNLSEAVRVTTERHSYGKFCYF